MAVTDHDLQSRLRALADRENGIDDHAGMDRENGPLLLAAADRLDDLQACKLDAERALGATADSAIEAVSLLATEHLNLQRLLAETSTAQGKRGREVAMWRKRCERYEAWMALPPDQRHPHGPEFDAPLSSLLDGPDPAPVALPRRDPADRRERLRTVITTPEQRARSGAAKNSPVGHDAAYKWLVHGYFGAARPGDIYTAIDDTSGKAIGVSVIASHDVPGGWEVYVNDKQIGFRVEAATAGRAIALARDLDVVKVILAGRTADQIEAAKPTAEGT